MADLTQEQWMDQEKQRLLGYGVLPSQYGAEGEKYLQSGYGHYQNQQRNERETQSFLNAREDWYPKLQQSYMQAVQPGLQEQYNQATKRTALQDISRGVHGGSQGWKNQAGISQAYQGQLGQAQMQAASLADQQKQKDLLQAQQQRMGMSQNPYQGYGLQGQLQSIGAQQRGASMMQGLNAQSDSNAQGISNMWSQLYGNQLMGAAQGAKSYGMSAGMGR